MNGELTKAELIELSNDKTPKVVKTVPIQFNPNTLTLKLSNQSEGGNSRGRQRRQHTGVSSTTLSMDLVFDTSDEGQTDAPVSVRTKTAIVEKFVVTQKGKASPPKLRFSWGDLEIDGVVSDLSIDFDHFSPGGVPLRAKVSLSLTEQDAKYELLETGDGSNANNNATTPRNNNNAGNAATPGSDAPSKSDQSGVALQDETAAEFAARMGLDPQAWRGLDVDLSAGLSLEAGVEIGFSAGLNVSTGIGVSAGVEADVNVSLEASLGLEAAAGGVGSVAQGKTLAAAGGLAAAVESVKISETTNAVSATRDAFSNTTTSSSATDTDTGSSIGTGGPQQGPTTGAPVEATTASTVPQTGPPDQSREPVTASGTLSRASQQAAVPAPLPPRADSRATSFGFGVPLRPRYGFVESSRYIVVGSDRNPTDLGSLRLTNDPTIPGWKQLPERDTFREQLTDQSRSEPQKHCGCCGNCSH